MASYLITGTSRGLGHALVSHLLTLPASEVGTIFATARKVDIPRLSELANSYPGRVSLLQMDVTDSASIQGAAQEVEKQLQGKGLDVLINNAGVLPVTPGGVEKMNDLESTMTTNVTSVHMVTQAFLPLLRQGKQKRVVNISTSMGSMAMAPRFKAAPVPAYKITKAALNMLTVQYAQDLVDEGFTVFAISPGWLRTDLGGAQADLSVETGAEAVIKTMRDASTEQNGQHLNIHVPGWEKAEGPNQYDGQLVPW